MKVYIITADDGGGHRTLAETLTAMIEEKFHLPVEWIDVAEIWQRSQVYHLFSYDWVPTFFNNTPQFVLSVAQRLFQRCILYYLNKGSQKAAKHLLPFWQEKEPSLVISVYPLTNKILYDSLHHYNPHIPLLTVIADYGEMCPGAWCVKQDQYYVCCTEQLYNTLMEYQIPSEKILKTQFLLPSTFYLPHYEKKQVYCKELGLEEDLPTIIIVFGAYGSRAIPKIFQRLNYVKQKLQLIFLTGKNRQIPSCLKHSSTHHKIVAIPFTTEIEKYFAISDILIGKPGPNIVTQAISQRLPVIVDRNFFTMSQEKFVADFVERHEVGVVVKNFTRIDQVITELLETGRLDVLRENTAKEKNNSYNETASSITKILSIS